MKSNKNLTVILAIFLCVIFSFALAACGVVEDDDDNDGDNTGIGSNPTLPLYSQTAPENVAALATSLESAGYEVEQVATGIVYGTKTANAKDYEYYGINTAVASSLNEYALIADSFQQMFDSFKMLNSTDTDALKTALTEDGITNFNISSNAMSWTDSEGSYSVSLCGDWVLVEVISEASGGDGNDCTHSSIGTNYGYDATYHWLVCNICGNNVAENTHAGNPCTLCGYAAQSGSGALGDYNLPTNIKIVLDRGNPSSNGTTVIKVGNDYYGFALSNFAVTGAHRYLKYDSTANNWRLFTGTGTTFGNPSSGWTAGDTISASGLKNALGHIGFFNFTLSYLDNPAGYSKTGTDTFLNRNVTIYSNGGTNVLFVDDVMGIILKAQIGFGSPYQVTEITTASVSMNGINIPSNEIVGLELPSAQIFNSFGINRSTFSAVSLSGALTVRNFFEGMFLMLGWDESNVSDYNVMKTYFANNGWIETYSEDDEDYPEFTATKGDFTVWITYSSDSAVLGLTIMQD